MLGKRETHEIGTVDCGLIGSAAICERVNVGVAFDRASKLTLVCGDECKALRGDPSDRRELVGRRENAVHAGDATEADLIGGMRHDPIAADRSPNLRLVPAVDGPPVIHMAGPTGAAARVGAMRLEGEIAGARCAFLCAFAGNDEEAFS